MTLPCPGNREADRAVLGTIVDKDAFMAVRQGDRASGIGTNVVAQDRVRAGLWTELVPSISTPFLEFPEIDIACPGNLSADKLSWAPSSIRTPSSPFAKATEPAASVPI